MAVDEARLRATTDASVWAEEFVKEFDGEAVGDSRFDAGTMIGWFANAIEAGRAEGRRTVEVTGEPPPPDPLTADYCFTRAAKALTGGGLSNESAHASEEADAWRLLGTAVRG